MVEGLSTAAAGMLAQQQKLDAVANDLANINTTGYKHVRVGFKDLLYEQAGRPAAGGVRTGHGAIVVAEHAGGDLSLATGSGDLRVAVRRGMAAES